MVLQGRNLIIESASTGISFAGAKSCEINVSASTIETSTPTDGQWETYIKGRKSWSIHINHLVIDGLASEGGSEGARLKAELAMVGQTVNISVHLRSTGSNAITGTAIIEQWKVSGSWGHLVQGSFVLKGSGPLAAPS